MGKLNYVVGKAELKKLVLKHLQEVFRGDSIRESDVKFEVITLQNYRAKEWEDGDFRAVVEKEV